MRRFSQRNSLVTLSDINITPLLDLAFVLLIIFVITTPLLEKGMPLQLPTISGQTEKPLTKKDIRVVEFSTQGRYQLDRRPMSLDQIARQLGQDAKANPNMVVDIRGDKGARYELFTDVMDRCEAQGITRISIRGNPPRAK
jgi:biopolymer transport protein ExbD